MKQAFKAVFLFLCGGLLYVLFELLWRGYSHWTMFLLGGLCFVLIGAINEFMSWETSIIFQGIIGSVCVITPLEFLTGCVVNLWLGWNVWDYSEIPLNLLGQICLPFSLLWILISMIAVVLDDWIRYFVFGEERPHYKIL